MAFFALLVLTTMFEKTFFKMVGSLFGFESDDDDDMKEEV